MCRPPLLVPVLEFVALFVQSVQKILESGMFDYIILASLFVRHNLPFERVGNEKLSRHLGKKTCGGGKLPAARYEDMPGADDPEKR